MQQGAYSFRLNGTVSQAKTDRNGIIHHQHLLFVQMAHMLPQTLLINGADLLQQDHRILAEPHTAACDIDMCRKPGLSCLAGDGSGNDRGRMAVARVILYDQNRSCSTLLAATTGERSA